MRIVSFLLLLVATPALAGPGFDARLASAKAAVATRPGFIYDTAMVPAVHHALVPCVPPGRDPGRGGEFTLVADVDRSGRVDAIEVRPSTPLARCFAQRFGAMTLRTPPASRTGRWPIAVEMQTGP